MITAISEDPTRFKVFFQILLKITIDYCKASVVDI